MSTQRPGPHPGRPDLPVALVVVDVGLPHLDRPFEYAVPPALDAAARPGVRVKVAFAGRHVGGFVIERRAVAEHAGRLAAIRRVVSDEPVLTPRLLQLTRAVADRYAGTLADVLRLAVPPRHAAAERALPREPPTRPDRTELRDPPAGARDHADTAEAPTRGAGEAAESAVPADAVAPGPWSAYPAGPAFLRRVAAGEAPAASWLALPRGGGPDDWPHAFAAAARAAVAGGRGFLLVVPDRRDLDRLETALAGELGAGRFVRLTADQGPRARYTAWLKVLRGHVDGVVGTRSAAFAPVRRLGLVAWWDDGDDLYAEPRAPYPHVRDVLAAQAHANEAALLSGGYVRSVPVAGWVAAGRLRHLGADRRTVRANAPPVTLATEGRAADRDGPAARAHLPPAAWRTAREALRHGPVLVQVPRRGYVPALTCQECRTPARCDRCAGPLTVPAAEAPPVCRWCGRLAVAAECSHCGARAWRSAVIGHGRTAEELGRAFPSVPVLTSGGPGGVVAGVDDRPRLVIATPGAEPLATGGYAAALLLDAWAFLDRPTLDAGAEALRRWVAAAALVRSPSAARVAVPAGESEPATLPTRPVVLCGAPDSPVPAVEALIRWAPEWYADTELAQRSDLGLPPAAWMALLTGSRSALDQARRVGPWPDGVLLGDVVSAEPSPASGGGASYRMLVRVPPRQAAELNAALIAMRARGSARKDDSTPVHRVGVVDAR